MAFEVDSTRRGTSMDNQSKKRKTAFQESAQLDPLSLSTPDTKRPFTEASMDTQFQLRADTDCTSRVFDMPTGNLQDRFLLSDPVLGSGQFGSVRECTDLFTGERLACKTIFKQSGSRATSQAAELRNEVGIMLSLAGHDNLVQIRGIFEDSDSVHLVMDLCEGGDLFSETVRRQRFSEPDAAVLFADIVRAVAFCHARGVLHRDLKPENILLTRRPNADVSMSEEVTKGPIVKIADLGLSATLSPGQEMKGMAGSPFYMAPEVITGSYNCKADVWSLGVILYILLSGSPPFWGQADADVFQATLSNKPELNAGPFSGVSAEAKSLIRCLLNKNPEKRPPAQKILTHPWLLKHVARKTTVRRCGSNTAGQVSISVN